MMVWSSRSIWIDRMSLSVWSSPSIVTCRLTSGRGGRSVFGAQCRMEAVGCVPTRQVEESLVGGVVHVVVGDLGHDVFLLDDVEKRSTR